MQGLLEAIGIPYTGSAPGGVHALHRQGFGEVLDARGSDPHARVRAFKECAIKDLGVAASLPGLEQHRLSAGRQAGQPGLGAGRQVRALRLGASGGDRGCALLRPQGLLERYVRGRDLAVSVLDAPAGSPPTGDGSDAAPVALPVVEAIPREEEFYNYESRYEIGMTTFVCPAQLPDGVAARTGAALQTYKLLGCHGVARVDLMLEEQTGELTVLETNVVPGLTETSLLPLAADAAEIWLDLLVQRILDSAFTR